MVVRKRWGAWYAAAGLGFGALALVEARGAAADEAARCSAWRAAEAPNERIELRTCRRAEAAEGKAPEGADGGDAGAVGAGDEDAAGDSDAADDASGGAGEPQGAALDVELRSGHEEPRKLRVELTTAGGAAQTLEAEVHKGVQRVGACEKCREHADLTKWRVLDNGEGDPVRPVAATNHMEVLARDLRLTDANAERLKRIATRYHKATRKRLVVTGGTRPPQRQAQLMYDKLRRGEDVMAIYENKPAALEVRNAYRAAVAKDLTRKRVVQALTEVIEAQIARGVYVSKHLRNGAVDVRSWDMTGPLEQAFKEAVKAEPGVTIMDERKSQEPHFHLNMP